LGLALIDIMAGVTAFNSPRRLLNGVPFLMLFFIAIVMIVAAIGDLRAMRFGMPRGGPRLARHLWRMCFALFIAAGSFFSVRERVAKILPEPFTTGPMRALPILLLFGAMFYWLWRVRGRLLSRDPATTAANINAAKSLWRFHVAAEFFLLSCAIAVLLILYVLLRSVDRDLALLAAMFNIVAISVEAVSAFLDVAPNQSQETTKVLIRLHGHGFGVSLLFFGWFCVTIGYLIFKSQYFPKAIGVLMQIAGVCYLINSFALIASPSVANLLFPAILIPSFIGEVSLALWLLIKGVRIERWRSLTSAPAA
jgi:Domain of unknown function (DUF4386)